MSVKATTTATKRKEGHKMVVIRVAVVLSKTISNNQIRPAMGTSTSLDQWISAPLGGNILTAEISYQPCPAIQFCIWCRRKKSSGPTNCPCIITGIIRPQFHANWNSKVHIMIFKMECSAVCDVEFCMEGPIKSSVFLIDTPSTLIFILQIIFMMPIIGSNRIDKRGKKHCIEKRNCRPNSLYGWSDYDCESC